MKKETTLLYTLYNLKKKIVKQVLKHGVDYTNSFSKKFQNLMLPGMPLLKFELSSMSSILQILKECLALISCINNCSMSLPFKLKQETYYSNSCQVIFGIPLLNFFFKPKLLLHSQHCY